MTVSSFLWVTSPRTEEDHPVPVLVMHGDDDQIVPYADAGPLSAKLWHGTLNVSRFPARHADYQRYRNQRRPAGLHQDHLDLTAPVTRPAFVQAVASLAGTAALWPCRATGAPSGDAYPSPGAAADEVRAEFLHGWRGYRDHAWGHDELLPVSGGSREFFLPKHSVGLSIVEALDTLYVMGLDAELAVAVDWLRRNLDFGVKGDERQVFEAIIRLVGGLLAGHFATGESFLLDRARDLR